MRYAAFTRDPMGGNPAGVVVADRLPPDARMQQIATRIGFSETAFIAPRGDAAGGADEYDVRYFSPEREVTFCGHATIAAGVALGEEDVARERVVFVSRTDRIPVAVVREGDAVTARLTSPPASHEPVDDGVLDAALRTFGWERGDLDPAIPPVVASAGASHLVLPVASRETLRAMRYDYAMLRTLMLREGWTTVEVIWRESPTRFHARDPFPVGGVVEDPATGAAAAALGGYLRDAGLVRPPARLTILQGEDMGRTSELLVDVPAETPGIDVSGAAVRLV